MSLLVIVPSRGRPEAAVELEKAFTETVEHPDSRLMFAVDDDDEALDEYRDRLPNVGVGPRLRMAPTLNAVAAQTCESYDYLGFMGDDHRPRTPGWDLHLCKAATGGIAYGNDLLQGINLPTAVVMDARIVRTLGRMVPFGLVHLYLDNYWKDLGAALRHLRYLPDVVIEHMHPIAGKAEWDAGYREVNDGALYAADRAIYETFCDNGGLAADVAAVRAAL